jgi:hypothetical protein
MYITNNFLSFGTNRGRRRYRTYCTVDRLFKETSIPNILSVLNLHTYAQGFYSKVFGPSVPWIKINNRGKNETGKGGIMMKKHIGAIRQDTYSPLGWEISKNLIII